MSIAISAQEVSRHNRAEDLWLVIDGAVYDVTKYAAEHPGGAEILLRYAGRDATSAYRRVHSPSLLQDYSSSGSVMTSFRQVGLLDTAAVPALWEEDSRPAVQANAGNAAAKPPLDSLISARDFARVAARTLSPKTWAFVSSAATDLHTLRRNTDSYAAITLRPRVLRNVSRVDISTSVLGIATRSPIFCAPTSLGRLFHPSGEKALARACRSIGIPQCVSTSASVPLADIVAAAREPPSVSANSGSNISGSSNSSSISSSSNNNNNNNNKNPPFDVPFFLQLYVDRDRRKSERLLADAMACGIKAVFLTVDAPVPGKREADERMPVDERVFSPISGATATNDAKGGALGRVMGGFIDASLAWADLPWLRRCVPGVPVVLKGVQTAADAVRAAECGLVDGILVSNHGGRSLDTAPASILVLLELQKCCPQVFDRLEVYVDGGITRGTDIFKALCLGARAVGIGRGFLYGLNYGEEGVKRYVEILHDELETTMRMCGVTRLDEVHPGFLNTLAVDHLIPDSDEHPYAKWRPKRASRL